MFMVIDEITGTACARVSAYDVVEAIRPWFPDAPDDVLEALDGLAAALVRGEPTRELEAYLAVSITREPAPSR